MNAVTADLNVFADSVTPVSAPALPFAVWPQWMRQELFGLLPVNRNQSPSPSICSFQSVGPSVSNDGLGCR